MPKLRDEFTSNLAFAMFASVCAHELAVCGLDAELPAAAFKAHRRTWQLRQAILNGTADEVVAAGLRVLRSALWDAWSATDHLEGHADCRLMTARDELEAAARLALGGVKGGQLRDSRLGE